MGDVAMSDTIPLTLMVEGKEQTIHVDRNVDIRTSIAKELGITDVSKLASIRCKGKEMDLSKSRTWAEKGVEPDAVQSASVTVNNWSPEKAANADAENDDKQSTDSAPDGLIIEVTLDTDLATFAGRENQLIADVS